MLLKNRIKLFALVQTCCIGFTICLAFLFQVCLSSHFDVGVTHSYACLLYNTILFFVYWKIRSSSLFSVVGMISLWGFILLICSFCGIYFGVFQPLFQINFNSKGNNCEVIGLKSISLHGNERYTLLFTNFQDENNIQRLGLACMSDNGQSGLFDTNIQPYKFLFNNQTYRSYQTQEISQKINNQCESACKYTFSSVKFPSWLCSQSPFNFYNTPLESCLVGLIGEEEQVVPISETLQYDSSFYGVYLANQDPLYELISFKVFIIAVFFPLAIISPQYFLMIILTRIFPSLKPLEENSFVNKIPQYVISDDNSLVLNQYKLQISNQKQNLYSDQDKLKQKKILQDSTYAITTMQPMINSNNLSNQERINQLFNLKTDQNNFFSINHSERHLRSISKREIPNSNNNNNNSYNNQCKSAMNFLLPRTLQEKKKNIPLSLASQPLIKPSFANEFKKINSFKDQKQNMRHSLSNPQISIKFLNEQPPFNQISKRSLQVIECTQECLNVKNLIFPDNQVKNLFNGFEEKKESNFFFDSS